MSLIANAVTKSNAMVEAYVGSAVTVKNLYMCFQHLVFPDRNG